MLGESLCMLVLRNCDYIRKSNEKWQDRVDDIIT
jgi:hypothetical protein